MTGTTPEDMLDNWAMPLQNKLYLAAKRSATRRFGILMDKVTRLDFLREAWRRVKQKRGAAGVDRQSIKQVEEYGEERFIIELQQLLQAETYRAKAIRRVYIPKDNGSQRPLGIPVVKDRVAQMAVKLVIEPLFEVDFCGHSYGFRPKRSNQQAAQRVHYLLNRRKWAVTIDIKGYFDTIPHDRLLDLVRQRVSDRKVIDLIRQWLKAAVFDAGVLEPSTSGTPQGGVLSPLLSNIYLHEFDRRWDSFHGEVIRFADDLVILCWNRSQAEEALRQACALLESLALTVNRDKTQVVHARDGFDFLGFRYKEAWSSRRKWWVRIKFPRPKALQKARQRIKERIRSVPLGEPLTEVIKTVNRTLRGWANYFRIGNSSQAGYELARYVCEQLRLWWRRHKNRKCIRGTRRWPNSFYYDRGLLYVPALLNTSKNAVR